MTELSEAGEIMMRSREMPETTWAYIAGIIDGEGHVRIGKSINKSTGKASYTPRVRVRMKELGACQLLADIFNNQIGIQKTPEPYADVFMVTLTGQDAVYCLTRIRPYLMVKGAQADLILSLEWRWRRAMFEYYDKREVYEDAFQHMKKLNAHNNVHGVNHDEPIK
jgi:hypothetical protein